MERRYIIISPPAIPAPPLVIPPPPPSINWGKVLKSAAAPTCMTVLGFLWSKEKDKLIELQTLALASSKAATALEKIAQDVPSSKAALETLAQDVADYTTSNSWNRFIGISRTATKAATSAAAAPSPHTKISPDATKETTSVAAPSPHTKISPDATKEATSAATISPHTL